MIQYIIKFHKNLVQSGYTILKSPTKCEWRIFNDLCGDKSAATLHAYT